MTACGEIGLFTASALGKNILSFSLFFLLDVREYRFVPEIFKIFIFLKSPTHFPKARIQSKDDSHPSKIGKDTITMRKKKIFISLLCTAALLTETACGFITFNTGETEPPVTAEADTEETTRPLIDIRPFPEDTAEAIEVTDTEAPDTEKLPDASESIPSATLGELARERLESLPNKDLSASALVIATTDKKTVCPPASASTVESARADVAAAVEEKFNTQIITDVSDIDTIYEAARESGNSGTHYADVLAIPNSQIGRFVAEGLLADLRSVPYLHLSAEYYNARITDAATAGDAIYAVSGSACLNPDYLSCVFVNRDLAEKCGLENVYDLVNSGDWTWDKFFELSNVAASMEDTYGNGTSLSTAAFADLASHSMGIAYVTNPIHSLPTVDYMNRYRSEASNTVVDKLLAYIGGERAFVSTEDSLGAVSSFYSGNMLFYTDRLYCMQWIYDSGVNWGILPIPKYSAEETGYASLLASEAPVFCVLKNTLSYETSGLLIEALNVAAYGYTEAAYVEKCMHEYLRDNASIAMLELICQTSSTDFAHMYSSGFDYLAEATYLALQKAVAENGSMYNEYRRNYTKANYRISFKIKAYGK